MSFEPSACGECPPVSGLSIQHYQRVLPGSFNMAANTFSRKVFQVFPDVYQVLPVCQDDVACKPSRNSSLPKNKDKSNIRRNYMVQNR